MRKTSLTSRLVEANAETPCSSPFREKRRFSRLVAASLLSAALFSVPGTGRATTLSIASFNDLAERCGPSVAPSTLAAIANTESKFRPHVVSDNTSHKVRDFDTKEDAAALANNLIAHGHSVDLGLMQINSANLARLGYTTYDALDACRSVAGGAQILSRSFVSSGDAADAQVALRRALSRYNTGNSWAGYRNGYVRRVEQSARMLLAASVAPAAMVTSTRTTAPLSREVSAVGWSVWEDATHSIGSQGAQRSKTFLVF